MESPSAADETHDGDTFSFSGTPTSSPPTTATTARRRGGAAAGRGTGQKTRASSSGGRGARGGAGSAGRGRGRGGARAAAAAAAALEDQESAATGSGAPVGATQQGTESHVDSQAQVGATPRGGAAENHAAEHEHHRNGTARPRPEQVQQLKEMFAAEICLELVDELLHEVVFDLHRKAKLGLMCFNCEDQYPSGVADKNGYDIFGQAVSGKIVAGEVRFECLNCGRTVVASRYAPHLEKCMGIGRMARNSSRIASRRMKASGADDDVYGPNAASMYMASPSFDDDEDEDEDDGTYGEHGKHRVAAAAAAAAAAKEGEMAVGAEQLFATATGQDAHVQIGGGVGSSAKPHRLMSSGTVAGSARGKPAHRKQPPKKKGRLAVAEAEAALISALSDEDSLSASGGENSALVGAGDHLDQDVVVEEEMDAGVAGSGMTEQLLDIEDLSASGGDEEEEMLTLQRQPPRGKKSKHARTNA